jgi:hypothetical protein
MKKSFSWVIHNITEKINFHWKSNFMDDNTNKFDETFESCNKDEKYVLRPYIAGIKSKFKLSI